MAKAYNSFAYGSPGMSKGLRHALSVSQGNVMVIPGKLKILVVGSGNGYELVHFLNAGHDVVGIDLYVPEIQTVKDHTVKGDASNMPFADDEFDLVFCTEMLEHVPIESIDSILSEIRRVGKQYYITIATEDDPPFHEHVTIKSGSWWINRFEENDLKISMAQIAPRVVLNFGSGLYQSLTYIDGVLIYGRCKGV